MRPRNIDWTSTIHLDHLPGEARARVIDIDTLILFEVLGTVLSER
jgi:hypothetical protein